MLMFYDFSHNVLETRVPHQQAVRIFREDDPRWRYLAAQLLALAPHHACRLVPLLLSFLFIAEIGACLAAVTHLVLVCIFSWS